LITAAYWENLAGVPPNITPINTADFEQEIEEKMTTECEGRFIGIRGGSIE
jgi:hypothetical protein